MNFLKNLWHNNSGLKHTLVSFWVFVTAYYAASPGFQSYVKQVALAIYNKLPAQLEEFVTLALIPALIYWNTQRKAAQSSMSQSPGTAQKIGAWALIALLPALCVGGLSGCHTSTSVPSTPQLTFAQTVEGADRAADALAKANNDADQAAMKYYQAGDMDAGDWSKTHAFFARNAQALDVVFANVRTVRTGGTGAADFTQLFSGLLQSVQTVNPSQFGIKNPNSQAEFSILISAFNAAVQAIQASYGGK